MLQEVVVRFGIGSNGEPLVEATTWVQVEDDHPNGREVAGWPGKWIVAALAGELPDDARLTTEEGYRAAWHDWHAEAGLPFTPIPAIPQETVRAEPGADPGDPTVPAQPVLDDVAPSGDQTGEVLPRG